MKRWIAAVTVTGLLIGRTAWADVEYTVTDLGTLGGSSIRPYDINDSGQIVGSSSRVDGASHAFLYDNGTMTDLGTLPSASYSHGRGINNLGEVVGYSGVNADNNHGFRYTGGKMTDLGFLPGYSSCVARAINDTGTITGYLGIGNDAHTFLYSNGAMTDIGKPAGYYMAAIPESINTSRQIAGYVVTSGGDDHASLYGNGQWRDLGTLGGKISRATCINNPGQIVGWSWTADGPGHAFFYENGIMNDIGVPSGWRSSVANGINTDGDVVGQCGQFNGLFYACRYRDGQWTNLNEVIDASSGWSLEEAVAINDSGWIVGLGSRNGETRAFLLVPVPEPSGFVIVIVAAISLFGYAWRRRVR